MIKTSNSKWNKFSSKSTFYTFSEMSSESVVDLNVGGLLYTTSIGTLTKVETYFTFQGFKSLLDEICTI